MLSRLAAIAGLQVIEGASLAQYTRFAIGGSARLVVDASTESALVEAIAAFVRVGDDAVSGCPSSASFGTAGASSTDTSDAGAATGKSVRDWKSELGGWALAEWARGKWLKPAPERSQQHGMPRAYAARSQCRKAPSLW